jgi:hypothetical protein
MAAKLYTRGDKVYVRGLADEHVLGEVTDVTTSPQDGTPRYAVTYEHDTPDRNGKSAKSKTTHNHLEASALLSEDDWKALDAAKKRKADREAAAQASADRIRKAADDAAQKERERVNAEAEAETKRVAKESAPAAARAARK